MANNAQAKKKIRNAILDLMTIRDRSNPTPAQKKLIEKAISALEKEHLALSGKNPNATYSEIASGLASAESDLRKIVAERNQLINHLTSAAKILGSLTSVIKLFS